MSGNPTKLDSAPVYFFNQLYRWFWIVTLVGGVILGVAGGIGISVNFVAGAGLSVLLIRVTQTVVMKYVVPGDELQHKKQKLLVLVLLKIPLLVVICGAIVFSPWFHPAGFLIGAGVSPILILILGGRLAFSEP